MKLEDDQIILIKKDLLRSLQQRLEDDLRNTKIQLEQTKQAAVEAPGAMQSHSDVSKSQYSCLASNLYEQIIELEKGLEILKDYKIKDSTQKKIIIGSLIETTHNSQEKIYFIFPVGGGKVIENYNLNNKITIITPQSPLGNLLLDKKVGDLIIIMQRELVVNKIF